MDLRSIYIANGLGIYILLLLLYVSHTRSQRQRVEDRIFMFMVFSIMVGCFMEAFSYTIDGQLFPGARALNYAANTYLYTFNLLLPFSVLVYVDLGLYGDIHRIWKYYKLQIVVGAVMLLMNIVNFIVPVTYYITDLNVYERRPLSYAYYVVILFYCLTALLVTRRYERENGSKRFVSITAFLVPILIGAGLQFMFYGLSLAWLSAAVGVTGLFMMQQNEMAYLDSLVDTYNRQYLDHVLTAWINRGKTFAGAMVDVDGFKGINDELGHAEGDKALITVADVLKQSCSEGELVFRFAGDEFIVLKMAESADGLDSYLDKMNGLLEETNRSGLPYKIQLSYGVSFFDSGTTDAFMKDMDDKMYAMKAQHHANRAMLS